MAAGVPDGIAGVADRFGPDFRAGGEQRTRNGERRRDYAETASRTDWDTFGGAGSKRSWRHV